MPSRDTAVPRSELIADTAIGLLAERGLRGLTHRAVDEAAGLPQGSTSNLARTRAALLQTVVERLTVLEGAALLPQETPPADEGPSGPGPLADLVAAALHRHLTRHRTLLVARYELALEATRRPELRAHYNSTGRSDFAQPLRRLLSAAGSTAPERHTLSLLAWCEGIMFTCTAGSYNAAVPSEEELRTGLREILAGLLAPAATAPGTGTSTATAEAAACTSRTPSPES
ncbi:TetR/AcrR family transcriptional regulator [Streptomyces tubbatahanensis]|uniref:TetR/AcrR family transcriptional regulator n=1 Tax=Streptomyces tubbatahanensis TaxID=2923272 RepID=A0ABY3XMT2_9ACTN|nr:TetR/AcrR family transcriptional regulator [Streptomyces tubbatahanensis]UNS95715.1 TetR/AcrR family transcriptional regulator [Streptomyces tubbatahanensis]